MRVGGQGEHDGHAELRGGLGRGHRADVGHPQVQGVDRPGRRGGCGGSPCAPPPAGARRRRRAPAAPTAAPRRSGGPGPRSASSPTVPSAGRPRDTVVVRAVARPLRTRASPSCTSRVAMPPLSPRPACVRSASMSAWRKSWTTDRPPGCRSAVLRRCLTDGAVRLAGQPGRRVHEVVPGRACGGREGSVTVGQEVEDAGDVAVRHEGVVPEGRDRRGPGRRRLVLVDGVREQPAGRRPPGHEAERLDEPGARAGIPRRRQCLVERGGDVPRRGQRPRLEGPLGEHPAEPAGGDEPGEGGEGGGRGRAGGEGPRGVLAQGRGAVGRAGRAVPAGRVRREVHPARAPRRCGRGRRRGRRWRPQGSGSDAAEQVVGRSGDGGRRRGAGPGRRSGRPGRHPAPPRPGRHGRGGAARGGRSPLQRRSRPSGTGACVSNLRRTLRPPPHPTRRHSVRER